MKNLCVSMAISEKVLSSYLLRVFNGELVEKKTCKTVRFPEENLLNKKNWTIELFKNFCEATVSNKEKLKMYKAKINYEK